MQVQKGGDALDAVGEQFLQAAEVRPKAGPAVDYRNQSRGRDVRRDYYRIETAAGQRFCLT